MAQRFGTVILAVWLAAMLVGCGRALPSGQPAPTPGGVVVTVRVADAEEYRLRLTDAYDIAIAQRLLAGESAPRIPNGRVVRGDPDVNVGYSWHIDPGSVEFVDTTTEPSYASQESPADLLASFYNAIDRQEYQRVRLLGDTAQPIRAVRARLRRHRECPADRATPSVY